MGNRNLDSWQALSPYLDQALALEEAERTAWLESVREQNPEIAAELQTLLKERRLLEEEGFLERCRIPLPGDALAGQAIGAYTLIAPIGHGGMGTVWLAARSDGRFERQAAVKFLNIALAGDGGEERFKREGAILGRCAHPQIAQLLDAGVSPAGQPYLVLEHVRGEPIDRYCEVQKLDVESRVRLFVDVLAAVAHAHANLIVHRDIKPSNVLVSSEGQVKLLDFGIAKLVEDEGQSAATALTREAGGGMTLLYAAPEQVKGESVTTAIDVYALGVLLYALLSGQHPAGPGPHSAASLIKTIVDTEPPRPSDVAGSDKLRRLLRGDLDTIVSKALKKNPRERYASVTAFADDLRRYLKHEPVAARPDTLAYRVSRFIRRNPTPVALAAFALLASASAVIGTTIQARTANRERIIAQRRFNEVRQLSNKLFDIEKQVLEIPGAVKARQLIVDTSLDYLGRLAKDARTDPDLALDLGFAYLRVARIQGVPVTHTLGQSEKAEETLRKAESLIAFVLAAQPANRMAFLRAGQIAHDRMVLAEYRVPDHEALPLARQSTEWLEKYLNSGKVDEAEKDQFVMAGTNVANWYIQKDLIHDGLHLLKRTIEVAKANNLPRRLGAAQMIAVRALRRIGDLDAALAASREAVSLLQPPPGAKLGPTSGLAVFTQGEVLGEDEAVSLGRPREAAEYFERGFGQALDFVRQDPNDAVMKLSVSNRGIKLAGVVRHWDPRRALEIYDEVLLRLGEVKNNTKARRDEVRALAWSAYPLVQMGRSTEARRRLDLAFSKMRDLRLYPADKIEPRSEPVIAMRALADFEAGAGNVPRGVEMYQELVTKLRASDSQPEANLEAATELSLIFQSMAQLYRLAKDPGEAGAIDARRMDLWRHWDRKLPNNPFVRRQLAAAGK